MARNDIEGMLTARWQVNRRPLDARRVVLMSSVGTRRTRTGFRRYRGTIQEGVVGSVRVASKAPLRAVVDVTGGQWCCEEVTMLSEVMIPKLGKRRYTTSLTRRESTFDGPKKTRWVRRLRTDQRWTLPAVPAPPGRAPPFACPGVAKSGAPGLKKHLKLASLQLSSGAADSFFQFCRQTGLTIAITMGIAPNSPSFFQCEVPRDRSE